jgi:zinc D-Ala-D-Ala carboxypeptidase
VIYAHYSEAPWSEERWQNFSAKELACSCCGEYYHDDLSLDQLQSARSKSGRGYNINSGHRCVRHNKEVGGAAKSQHLKIAFDIALSGHDPRELETALRESGFTTFGYYGTFLHTDIRPGRIWYSNLGREKWEK